MADRGATELTGSHHAWVLMYHGIVRESAGPWQVTLAEFEAHLDRIRRRGLEVRTLHEVVDGAGDFACLTFDDAYLTVYEHAFPLLTALGMTATVFVPTNFPGGWNTFDRDLRDVHVAQRIMDWSQLAELHRAGWSIQAHGCAHVSLAMLSPDAVAQELRRSRLTIEDRIGGPVRAFAYPYGLPPQRDTGEWTECLTECGYELGCLGGGGPVQLPLSDSLRVSRVAMAGEGRA